MNSANNDYVKTNNAAANELAAALFEIPNFHRNSDPLALCRKQPSFLQQLSIFYLFLPLTLNAIRSTIRLNAPKKSID